MACDPEAGKRLPAVPSPNRDVPIQDVATLLEMAQDHLREMDLQSAVHYHA